LPLGCVSGGATHGTGATRLVYASSGPGGGSALACGSCKKLALPARAYRPRPATGAPASVAGRQNRYVSHPAVTLLLHCGATCDLLGLVIDQRLKNGTWCRRYLDCGTKLKHCGCADGAGMAGGKIFSTRSRAVPDRQIDAAEEALLVP